MVIVVLMDIKVETKVESGDPRDVICEMVEKLGPDMLVMGSHGHGLTKRYINGFAGEYEQPLRPTCQVSGADSEKAKINGLK
ncbi:UspA [Dillenia turbinata]|uniref:UspA n=1 Tax=Dillenia turbinata TaxID=194707 RepID=A0AAN8UHG4_9MAGN